MDGGVPPQLPVVVPGSKGYQTKRTCTILTKSQVSLVARVSPSSFFFGDDNGERIEALPPKKESILRFILVPH